MATYKNTIKKWNNAALIKVKALKAVITGALTNNERQSRM